MAVEHKKTLGLRLEALAFDAYLGFFRALGVDRASAVGAGLIGALGPLTSVQKVARTNIRLAFPDIAEAEEKALLKAQWNNLGRTFAEYPMLYDLRAYGEDARVRVAGADVLDQVKADKKGAVFIGGHFANWETMSAAIVQRGLPCQVTYREMNNYWVERRFIEIRAKYGVKSYAPKGKKGGMGLLRALAKGETVAMMNDQKYNEGVAAPFFGTNVMTADGPTRLARRFDCPLIPLSVKRLAGARFAVTVHEPIPVDGSADEEAAVLATVTRVNAFMEQRIREAPADWFWVHRRWPKEVYKSSDPRAAALAALPFAGKN